MHPDDLAADVSCFGVPAHVIAHSEGRGHRSGYTCRCNLRTRHIDIASESQTARATARTDAALWCGSSFQTTSPNAASAIVPIAAPRASRAAAKRPRIVCGIPARRFFSRSCFSISVAPQGKIAGKAKNSPPTTGPKYLATSPVTTVIAPPNKNRVRYSCHWVCLREARFSRTFMRLL